MHTSMHTLNPLPAWTLALAVAAPCGAAIAQDDAKTPLQLRSLAATCAQCHGTDGRPPQGSLVPALAGRPAADTLRQMTAFKAETTPGAVMPQIAKGYSDAQIRSLSAYFAAQAR